MAKTVVGLRNCRYPVLRSGEESLRVEDSAPDTLCDKIGRALLAARGVYCLLISLFLLSCSPMRPVVKIGLLAPFEGLHRESGYEALSAMRAALADYPLDEFEALPLALDTSADPAQARRAAAKLLRDDSVAAVIGPLQARQVFAVADIMAGSDVDWRPPTTPATEETARALVRAIILNMPGQNIVVAGLDSGWPLFSEEELTSSTGKRVTIVEGASVAASADGALWLGSAPEGAAFLGRLRLQGRTVPFWTTSVATDPVFHSLLSERLDGTPPGLIYWVVALGEVGKNFNEWATTHPDAAPTAFAVYHATRRTLQQISGDVVRSNVQEIAIFTVDREGTSELAEIVPFP